LPKVKLAITKQDTQHEYGQLLFFVLEQQKPPETTALASDHDAIDNPVLSSWRRLTAGAGYKLPR
jgi:hypothetical protein